VAVDEISSRFERDFDGRFYCITVATDLFSEWVVTCIWGGIRSRRGGARHVYCAGLKEAFACKRALEKKRKGRGYKRV